MGWTDWLTMWDAADCMIDDWWINWRDVECKDLTFASGDDADNLATCAVVAVLVNLIACAVFISI